MKFEELQTIINALEFSDSFFWGAWEWTKNGFACESISSHNHKVIRELAVEIGFDYSHRTDNDEETVFYISFF